MGWCFFQVLAVWLASVCNEIHNEIDENIKIDENNKIVA